MKKRLQLFKDAFPDKHAAFGFWDFDAVEPWRAAVAAATSLGIDLAGVELRDLPYDYERGLQQVAVEFRGALFMRNSVVFVRDAERLAAFALRHRMVSCFDAAPLFVNAGGLMSYGADLAAAAGRATARATATVRISDMRKMARAGAEERCGSVKAVLARRYSPLDPNIRISTQAIEVTVHSDAERLLQAALRLRRQLSDAIFRLVTEIKLGARR